MGDHGTRLAQAKAQLSEQALALAHAQADPVALLEVGRQQLAIPEVAAQTILAGRQAQGRAHVIELRWVQPPRAPGAFSFAQSCQSLGFEAAHPVFHRAPRIPQQGGHFGASQSLGYQQHAMETVVVTSFLGTPDLVLQTEGGRGSIGDGERPHVSMKPHLAAMRNYL